MKRVVILAIVLFFILPSVLFASIASLNVGATAQFKLATGEVEADRLSELENWDFGPELRFRFLFAEVVAAGLYSGTEDDGHKISGILTGGVSLDVLGFLRVGLGMGPRMGVSFDKDFGNPQVITPLGPTSTLEGFGDAFMNAPMTFRATADLKLGKFLMGLTYMIDSNGFTFSDADYDKLLPDFENTQGRVGVSLLYNLF
ncbi:MAG: hypothetical protein ACOX0W_05485 [Sphaerochaetaceae bacterium]|jgi:hypothetical protein